MGLFILILTIIYFMVGEAKYLEIRKELNHYFLYYAEKDSFTINKNRTILHNSFSKESNWNKININLSNNIISNSFGSLNYKYCWLYAPYTYFTLARKIQKFIKTIEIDKLPVY